MESAILLLILALLIAGTLIYSSKLYQLNLKALSFFWMIVGLGALTFLGRYVEDHYLLWFAVASMILISIFYNLVSYWAKNRIWAPDCWLCFVAIGLILILFLWSVGVDLA